MQIHLKQREIETALKMFVAQQGINLTDKTFSVAFTSGRKDNGLSAELTIEDAVPTTVAPEASSPLSPITKDPEHLVLDEPTVKASLFS